jgi:transcriptional regulator
MYIPAAFAETDVAKLHDMMEQNSFALLVSEHEGSPFATHLPLLLDRQSGPHGTLVGHMARANPQWQSAAAQEVLVVFSGPHAYISPTWYEAENVVPTWNYVAVHAYGTLALVDEPSGVSDIVNQFVQTYERSLPSPWRLTGSNTYLQRMLSQIVGFRIPIARLEGKRKLNQNHPVERRQKVIHVLRERGDEESRTMAHLIEETL